MTESEWLNSIDPHAMVEFLRVSHGPDERRYRLFACACVRRVWPLAGSDSRDAVCLAEQFADGGATEADLAVALRKAESVTGPRARSYAVAVAWAASWTVAHSRGPSPHVTPTPGWLAAYRASGHARDAAVRRAASDAQKSGGQVKAVMREVRDAEQRAQAALLRDVMGNPYRPRPHLDAAWLAWNDGAVAKMANTIYDDRRFTDLPLLADALEEAGCTNQDILGHCRNGGEHVRGCWVVDLLLGRE